MVMSTSLGKFKKKKKKKQSLFSIGRHHIYVASDSRANLIKSVLVIDRQVP